MILLIKFRSALSAAEVRRVMSERAPEFRALPGLLQKFYAYEPASGEYSGIYFWDSPASLRAFRESDLVRTIAGAYQVLGAPRVEVFDVVASLRAETLAPLVAPTA